ncbi:MAG: cobyric acid synthase [Thermoplasmatales archaeon]
MERGKLILVLGTSSGSGKSTIATAICRILSNKGYSVAPFKSVNMSRNSVSLDDGSEIARAQWLQAIASRTVPTKEMNPVLLKPESDGMSQVIINGRSIGVLSVRDYWKVVGAKGKRAVESSLDKLLSNYDVVVAEGAGSPSEINLKRTDLSNSFILSHYDPYAILVSDIERGGVFASILGTVELMTNPGSLRGVLINKMRGDQSILNYGIRELERRTGKKVMGIVPFIEGVTLPGEDSFNYDREPILNRKICVVKYPYMENYSDLDPLVAYGIGFMYITAENADMLESCDLIVLPGSKNVLKDIEYLKSSGIWSKMKKARKILGICGGFQILSNSIYDPEMVQATKTSYKGLGLLKCTFTYKTAKTTRAVSYRIMNKHLSCGPEKGYEIHYGEMTSSEEEALNVIDGRGEGAISNDGLIIGTNVHGILENSCFLKFILNVKVSEKYSEVLDENIEKLSKTVANSIDLSSVLKYVSSRMAARDFQGTHGEY